MFGIFIFLVFFVRNISVTSGASGGRVATFAEHRNWLKLEESETVLSTRTRSPIQCTLLCLRHADCQSISYDKLSKSCELLTGMEPAEQRNIDRQVMYTLTPTAKDCSEIKTTSKNAQGGVYVVGNSYRDKWRVYCDMETGGGGWTVFQRREDNTVNFNEPWVVYKDGFGNIDGEFWLGNEIIHKMTSSEEYKVRIDLAEKSTGEVYFSVYDSFRITNEDDNYRLQLGSVIDGNGGDILGSVNSVKFSTNDRDNDKKSSQHCALRWGGGWWFTTCYACGLNGEYGISFDCGLPTGSGRKLLSWSELKIKRD